jgi:Uri superfamily endonuclease
MLERFPSLGLGTGTLLPAHGKRLFWNVDHLLDREDVDLTGAILIRSAVRMERALALLLERDPATVVVESGLGANDAPSNTHILRVEADESWWCELPSRLDALRLALEATPTTPSDSQTPPRR